GVWMRRPRPRRRRRRPACRPRTSTAPITPSPPSRNRSLKATESKATEGRILDRTYLDWPFFTPEHRDLARALDAWAPVHLGGLSHGTSDDEVDADCRELVRRLAEGGFTRYAVPAAYGGALDALDSRSLCLIREHLAYY